jgi:putative membrane protein
MEFLKLILCGAVVGVANIIPGVSGGTLAVVLNLYDRLIEAVSGLTRHFWKSVKFLLPVAIGAGAGIVALAKLIDLLLERQYMAVNFFFIGVVIGSLPLLYKRMRYQGETKQPIRFSHWISGILPFLAMIAMAIGMVVIGDGSSDVTITTLSVQSFVILFVTLFVSAVCMIIPGVSGSFMMVLFGVYPSVIGAISEMNLLLLIPVALGALAGVLCGAKGIDWVLERFPQHSFCAIIGFVLGSIPVLLCKIGQAGAYRGGWTALLAAVVLLAGTALSYFGAKLGEKKAA